MGKTPNTSLFEHTTASITDFCSTFNLNSDGLPALCISQLEASTSPRAVPREFELFKIGLFKFPTLGAKSRSNAPPISNEIPLLKDKFGLQSTLFTLFTERYAVMTLKRLLKTLLKELFTNKGYILSCKSDKPCKNRKKLTCVLHYNTLEQEMNPVQIPHPSKATLKFPPTRARCTVKCPGYAWEGMLKLRFDR